MKKELNFHRGKGARLRPKHLAEAITKLGFTDEQIEKLLQKIWGLFRGNYLRLYIGGA